MFVITVSAKDIIGAVVKMHLKIGWAVELYARSGSVLCYTSDPPYFYRTQKLAKVQYKNQ